MVKCFSRLVAPRLAPSTCPHLKHFHPRPLVAGDNAAGDNNQQVIYHLLIIITYHNLASYINQQVIYAAGDALADVVKCLSPQLPPCTCPYSHLSIHARTHARTQSSNFVLETLFTLFNCLLFFLYWSQSFQTRIITGSEYLSYTMQSFSIK